MTDFSVIIPARYGSTRFPGKPLADIKGKTMIERVCERAADSGAKRIIVATDDNRIADVVDKAGIELCMTATTHQSGTERLAEVVDILALPEDEIIVNVQGDEPFIPEANITQVARNLQDYPNAAMATLGTPISDADEVFNPNAVKVVTDKDGYALYFSRASIPYDRERFMGKHNVDSIGPWYLRHIGIYAYTAGFIRRYNAMAPSELEQIESLEQLRVLWHGHRIHVAAAAEMPPAGIDTPQDLARALAR